LKKCKYVFGEKWGILERSDEMDKCSDRRNLVAFILAK